MSFRYSTDRSAPNFGINATKEEFGKVTAIAMDPDDNIVVIGTSTGLIKVYELDKIKETGQSSESACIFQDRSHFQQIR